MSRTKTVWRKFYDFYCLCALKSDLKNVSFHEFQKRLEDKKDFLQPASWSKTGAAVAKRDELREAEARKKAEDEADDLRIGREVDAEIAADEKLVAEHDARFEEMRESVRLKA